MIDYITTIKVEIFSLSPLSIGDKDQEPLIYDEGKTAYLPATGIAGAFKAYLKFIGKDYKKLFGDQDKKGKSEMSSVIVKDSFAKIINYDRRSGVSISDKYGSNENNKKFERNYLQKGMKFELEFEIQASKNDMEELKNMLYICLKALDKGIIRFGGSKSCGLGIFKVKKVLEDDYDLTELKDLTKYLNNIEDKYDATSEVMGIKLDNHYVNFTVKGELSTPLIIKGTEKLDSNDVDDRSIGLKLFNNKIEYFIPGSSFKGVLRSRAERIANYFDSLDEAKEMFGELKEGRDNILSRVFVTESAIEEEKESRYNRIKIDRFTGGVRHTALMNDIPVKGKTQFDVMYRKKGNKRIDDYSIGLITLALRDLATENLTLGGKDNIGRGRFRADTMKIDDGDSMIDIDFKNMFISNTGRLNEYVRAVKSLTEEEGGDD
jgi:CRISPR/Cas system CSM-associated protein Csm3 (group 7 of RAMP superfamily)